MNACWCVLRACVGQCGDASLRPPRLGAWPKLGGSLDSSCIIANYFAPSDPLQIADATKTNRFTTTTKTGYYIMCPYQK
jgi:hypothetical protein